MPRSNYATLSRPTQTQKAKANQVKNNAGGFVFSLPPLKQLERFLILGSDRPTYYQSAQALTVQNAQCVVACWSLHPKETLDLIVDVSDKGRAPKNDPAIFAMALGSLDPDPKTRQLVYANLHRVCRTASHLFQFVELARGLGKGWGRGMKNAVAKFYTEKNLDALGMQVIKYRQRNGYTHKRLLQTSHPKTREAGRLNLFSYIVGKDYQPDALPNIVQGFIEAQQTPLQALRTHPNLPWEALPTEALNDPLVWHHLLFNSNMGLTALMRNLGKMSSLGLLKPLSREEGVVISRFSDAEAIRNSRLHPFNILVAMRTYAAGVGFRGSNIWPVNSNIVAALEKAFYLAFDNLEPGNKRTFIGLDVSGSMSVQLNGTNLSAREAAAAMAMVTYRSEPQVFMHGFSNTFVDLNVTKNDSLPDVIRKIRGLPFAGTDCALPMIYAQQHKLEVDQFVVYTDNETYYGRVHPFQALKDYRRSSGIDAKLVVVGMTATNFSIADPSDPGMLDVVGFDTAVPALIAGF